MQCGESKRLAQLWRTESQPCTAVLNIKKFHERKGLTHNYGGAIWTELNYKLARLAGTVSLVATRYTLHKIWKITDLLSLFHLSLSLKKGEERKAPITNIRGIDGKKEILWNIKQDCTPYLTIHEVPVCAFKSKAANYAEKGKARRFWRRLSMKNDILLS